MRAYFGFRRWISKLFPKLCPGCLAAIDSKDKLLCECCQKEFAIFTNPLCAVCCQNRLCCKICEDLSCGPSISIVTCFLEKPTIKNMIAQAHRPQGWYLCKELARCMYARFLVCVRPVDRVISLPDRGWYKAMGTRPNYETSKVIARQLSKRATPWWWAKKLGKWGLLKGQHSLVVGLCASSKQAVYLTRDLSGLTITLLTGYIEDSEFD